MKDASGVGNTMIVLAAACRMVPSMTLAPSPFIRRPGNAPHSSMPVSANVMAASHQQPTTNAKGSELRAESGEADGHYRGPDYKYDSTVRWSDTQAHNRQTVTYRPCMPVR